MPLSPADSARLQSRSAVQAYGRSPARWSDWYLTDEDDRGQSAEQDEAVDLFKSILKTWVREKGWTDAYIGNDVFFGWREDHPLVRISPDVYLLRDAKIPAVPPPSWQVWKPGHKPPEFALEVVSEDWKKDYDEIPHKYAQLGIRELLVFDPMAPRQRAKRRVPLQLFRMSEEGHFERVASGAEPVWLSTLGAAARVVKTPRGPRLRLSETLEGGRLIPSVEEGLQEEALARAAAEAARREEALARAAAEVAQREAEAQARNEALARAAAEAARQEEALARTVAETAQRDAEAKARNAEVLAREEALARAAAEAVAQEAATKVRDMEAELAALRALVGRKG